MVKPMIYVEGYLRSPRTKRSGNTTHLNRFRTCEWAEDEDGNYDTECGEIFSITEGTPEENHMKYCCYCGRQVRGTPFSMEVAEDV